MKLRALNLACLIALAAGVAVYISWQHHKPTHPAQATESSATSAKSRRDEDDRNTARFKGVDPDLRKAILHLERALEEWEAANPDHGFREFDDFAIAEIQKLPTAYIVAIAKEIYGETTWWDCPGYDQSIFLVWGSRDPVAARAFLLAVAEANHLLGGEIPQEPSSLDEVLSDHFHHIRVGQSMQDPAAALAQYLADEADPRMKHFLGSESINQIFENYGRLRPEEAWQAAMSHPDHIGSMVYGFITGAPPGQDWLKLADEYDAALIAKGEEPFAPHRLRMIARWASDDPKAALDWYAANTAFKDHWDQENEPPPNPPPSLPGLDELPEEMLVKFELLRKARRGDWMDGDTLPQLIQQLVAQGEGDLAALTIAECLGGRSYDHAFFGQIRAFPDPDLRAALFLKATQAIYPHSTEDPFGANHDPQPGIDAIRALSATIDLPHEIKAQAEAHLREVEAAELKYLSDQARQRAEGDPFAQ